MATADCACCYGSTDHGAPAGVDPRVHRCLLSEGWSMLRGAIYRTNCHIENGTPCVGCESTGGIMVAYYDAGGVAMHEFAVPHIDAQPQGHNYCFLKFRGLME
jgi:hypothetical protein